MRLIGIAVASPNSSYFANYEVFLAERRVAKGQTQLIKLVYTFLPYQRRLSEYVTEGGKVYKLRVTRDPTCDESLLQMTWGQPDESPANTFAANSLGSDPGDRKTLLPCYRTNATDYRKAVTGN